MRNSVLDCLSLVDLRTNRIKLRVNTGLLIALKTGFSHHPDRPADLRTAGVADDCIRARPERFRCLAAKRSLRFF